MFVVGWVWRRVKRLPRYGTRAVKTAKKKASAQLDRGVTAADARWQRLFDERLSPRLIAWMETGAPRPVLLAGCLARLASGREDLPALEAFFARAVERFGEDQVARAVSRALPRMAPAPAREQARLMRVALGRLSDEAAEALAEKHIDVVWTDLPARRMLARRMAAAGRVRRPLELLEPGDPATERRRRALASQWRALERGITLSPAARAPAGAAGDRVMYVVAHSMPLQEIGYTLRTQSLVRSLRAADWQVEVFARLGYPADRQDDQVDGDGGADGAHATSAEVDGVPHHFRPDAGAAELELESYVDAAAGALVEQAGRFSPAVIHAASNYRVGLAGIEAARRLGIPSVYEMRGLWYESRAAKNPRYAGSEHFQMCRRLELLAAESADRVLVNGAPLRDFLIDAGVAPGRVAVIPNGVDVDRFQRLAPAADLRRELGLDGRLVVGFIGTFFHFEGIDYLVEAARRLRARWGDRVRFLLVGDGPEHQAVRDLAARLGVTDLVRFTGRVPHARVLDYYSLIDVAVYPRRGLPVCELVPPLKPLEAMAARRPVVVSSAAALRDLVEPGRTGLVHDKDDVASLCHCLEQLIDSEALRQRLGAAAEQQVQDQRWSDSAGRIAAVYRDLGMSVGHAGARREAAPGSALQES